MISLSKDKDSGSDALWLAEFERKLNHDVNRLYNGQIKINGIDALDSEQHELLQIADLFVGSISRLLNQDAETSKNQKDEFAAYVSDVLSIDPTSMEVGPEIDWVMTHVFAAG